MLAVLEDSIRNDSDSDIIYVATYKITIFNYI